MKTCSTISRTRTLGIFTILSLLYLLIMFFSPRIALTHSNDIMCIVRAHLYRYLLSALSTHSSALVAHPTYSAAWTAPPSRPGWKYILLLLLCVKSVPFDLAQNVKFSHTQYYYDEYLKARCFVVDPQKTNRYRIYYGNVNNNKDIGTPEWLLDSSCSRSSGWYWINS